MKKTFIVPSIKVNKMETTDELLADSYETFLHTEGSLPQSITNERELANKAAQRIFSVESW